MAILAICWETFSPVIGISCIVVIGDVTTHTSIGRILVAIGVAFQALSRDLSVSPKQWIDSIMIESRPLPVVLTMALRAVLRESCLLVIRICSSVEIFQVTTYASIGCILIAVGMTFQTLSRNLSMSS